MAQTQESSQNWNWLSVFLSWFVPLFFTFILVMWFAPIIWEFVKLGRELKALEEEKGYES